MVITDHYIVFTKDSQRNLNEKAITNNTTHIAGVNTKSLLARGWVVAPHPTNTTNWIQERLLDESANEYRYQLFFKVTHSGDAAPNKSELRGIVKAMNVRATNPLGG